MNGPTEFPPLLGAHPPDIAQPSELLRGLHHHGHALQFYEDDQFLLESVFAFLKAGIEAGDRLLVVTNEAHRGRIRQELTPALARHPLGSRALVMLDSTQTLSRLMVGERLDQARFDSFLNDLMKMLGEDPTPNIRAYGEMVNLLWRRGNARGAIRLEELWNDARKKHPFALLCAYCMSGPLASSDASYFSSVCDAHDLVLPTERFFRHADPAARLREVSTMQHRTRAHTAERARRLELERAVGDAMEALSRFERGFAEVNERERLARAKAEANDAFAELFLGVLKDGLGTPLRSMLSTARQMTSEGGGTDNHATILQLVSSARHIERMVEQLVEVTRVRSTGGIEVRPRGGQDIVAIVAKAVEDASTASPEYTVALHAPSTCVLRTDPARFEQVVANLIGNAVLHGDPAWPVNVTVAELGAEVSVTVQNCGEPIPPEVLEMLFSPFARGARPRRGPAGLGLGLYLSELIVSALGGRIEVESTRGGTLFEVVLPRAPRASGG